MRISLKQFTQRLHQLIIAAIVVTLACPLAVLADRGGTYSLGTGLSFDLTKGAQVAAGDFQFTGSSMVFQASARAGIMRGSGSQAFNAIAITDISAAAGSFSNQAIPAASMPAGTIIGVQTNSGNFAKILVNAISPNSISFQFLTYVMSITSVSNNSALNGYPIGIQPGSIVHVQGTELARFGTIPVLQDTTKGLPLMLNDTSVSATVGATTVQGALYYSSPNDVAFELPSGTPTGPGTLKITNGNNSVQTNIQVVPSGYAFTTYNGSAVLTDLYTGELVTFTHPAKWGGTYFTWGTGLGADPKHSDTTYGDNTTVDTPARIFLGNFEIPQENILFKGTLLYPGVQGFVFKIPNGPGTAGSAATAPSSGAIATELDSSTSAPENCFNPFLIITGNSTNPGIGNMPTAPVSRDASPCDTSLTIDAVTLDNSTRLPLVQLGNLQIGQTVSGSVTTSSAFATFQGVAGTNLLSVVNPISPGTCDGSRSITSSSSFPTTNLLDAGPSIKITGSPGSTIFTMLRTSAGNYSGTVPSNAFPSTGGTFEFTSGTGGPDIHSFDVTFNVPSTLNSPDLTGTFIDLTQDYRFSWTPNMTPGAIVHVTLTSTGIGATGTNSTVRCAFLANTGTGMVSSILMKTLSAGNGFIRLGIESDSLFQQSSSSAIPLVFHSSVYVDSLASVTFR
jgi:hypothetical protein